MLAGPHGKAWQYDLNQLRKTLQKRVGPDASVCSWFIYAPWANPIWHSYALHLIHLRAIPRFDPPIITLSGATHQLMLYALNPDWQPTLEELPHWLLPMNFAAQFIAKDDENAAWRMRFTVDEILSGELSPDTDFTQAWIARFGANMIKGDASQAGQTVIRAQYPSGKVEQVVIDPKSPEEKPKL